MATRFGLFKVRVIGREFMEAGLAPAWVRRSSDMWMVLFFSALFVIHFGMGRGQVSADRGTGTGCSLCGDQWGV